MLVPSFHSLKGAGTVNTGDCVIHSCPEGHPTTLLSIAEHPIKGKSNPAGVRPDSSLLTS